MKTFFIITLLFSINVYSTEYSAKKNKTVVKINLNINKEYEVKEKFLNTPLLIWNKKLKQHGPSIGIFPLKSVSKNSISIKGKKTNFENFKSKKISNLRGLKATKIQFGDPVFSKDEVRYSLSYVLPGNLKIYSTDVTKKCPSKGLQIKSVVKSTDYKKFKTDIEHIINSIKCVEN